MKYAYYPGCSAHSTARDMHESCLAVAKALGIELEEIDGWTCCGASAAHQTDQALAVSLASANLVLAGKMGMDMVVNCAACYNRSKSANHNVINSPLMRERVKESLGESYDGQVPVRHFVEVLLQNAGLTKLKNGFKKSLNNLKVACYYGCYLVRPPEVTGFDDAEDPMIMDDLVEAMGGRSLVWSGKVDCCGGSHNLSRAKITVERSSKIIEMASAAGAECITVACPMCQASLDLRQKDIEKAAGKRFGLPVLYITQLLGLCLGISQKELGLNRLIVNPSAVINRVGAISGLG